MSKYLNPIWLQTFLSLAKTKHFTQTAKALNMTQPGVTQHLQRLEEACGCPLIVRDGRAFELNDNGMLVYDYALQLFERESELTRKLELDDPFSGDITFACSGSLAQVLYPRFIELMLKYPALKLKLEAAPNPVIYKQIDEKQTSLGIVTQANDQQHFETREIGNQQLVVVLPISFANTQMNLSALQELGAIEHPDFRNYLDLYIKGTKLTWLADAQADELNIKTYVNQIQQILLPVAMGLGYTVIPKHTLDVFEQRKRLFVLADQQTVKQPLYLVHKRSQTLAKRHTTVIELCRQSI